MPTKKYTIDFVKRIANCNRTFKKWEEKFKIEQCVRYFEGFQWDKFERANSDYTPYTVNLVYTTIRIKRASLLFDNPTFIVRPAPEENAPGYDSDSAGKRANLKTMALNSFVSNLKNFFLPETKMAAEDAFFGFGIIEVGYSANIIDNPNAQKPAYDEFNSDKEDYKVVNKPEELLDKERVFIKRIPFRQFRASGKNAYILQRANWYGYYDYYDFKDAKEAWSSAYSDSSKFAGYRNTDADTGILSDESDPNDEDHKELLKSGDLVKIWKIWDNRTQKIYWWDESNQLELDSEPFEHSCVHVLAFDRARSGFLPIPPVFNWLSPQDEVNEASEQMRVHRRRSSRHYLYDKNRLSDEDEFSKMINGPDGTNIGVEGPVDATLIAPVPLAPLEASVEQSFLQSKDNFNIVTLTGSEERGQVDRETATAAAIKNQNSQQAEAEPKTLVAEWLNDIARSIILNLARITNPFWVAHMQPPDEHLGGQVQPSQKQFKQISGEDIEGEDFETDIEISSISPIDNQAELQKLLQFISIINQFQEVAISPMLVRKIASKVGIYDEEIIAEAQKMAQMRMVSMMNQAQAANQPQPQQGTGAPAAQKLNANNTPPAQEQIRNQLQHQLLPTG